MGAAGLRLPGDRRAELRRHLLLQLHEDRPAAGRAAEEDVRGADGGRARPRSTSRRSEVRFDGRAVPFEIDDERRHRLLNGLDDIALTLQQADAIAAYEHERERPARSRPRSDATCMAERSSLLPGDGDRPRGHRAPRVEVLDAVARRPRLRGAPGRRRGDRRPRHRADRRDARRLPARRRRAARRGRRPEVGHDRARRGRGRSRACSRLRKGLGLYANLRPVRAAPGALRRLAAASAR